MNKKKRKAVIHDGDSTHENKTKKEEEEIKSSTVVHNGQTQWISKQTNKQPSANQAPAAN